MASASKRQRFGRVYTWILAALVLLLAGLVYYRNVTHERFVSDPLLLHDLGCRPQFEAVHVVQRCEISKASGEPECLAAAALVSGKPGEVGIVRQQLVDQVSRFFDQHRMLLETTQLAEAGTRETPPSLRNVIQALRDADLGRAFSQLYTLQKQLVQGTSRATALEAGYYVSGHVLFGLPTPAGMQLETLWAPA